MAVPFRIPTNNAREFPLLHVLPALGVISLFNFSPSSQCVVVSCVVLIGIFLVTNDIEHLSTCVSMSELL